MLKVIYSKKNKAKLLAATLSGAEIDRERVLLFHPKNTLPSIEESSAYQYEDIGKTKTWLTINELIDIKKIDCLVLDNPSRYSKVESNKVARLQKLVTKVEHRVIIDIVPFTADIKYIYTPYSYLDRSILGYPHFYAFRENYGEEDSQGRTRYAHDYDLLAEKINSYCKLDYEHFFASNRQTIGFANTAEEADIYLQERQKVVEEDLKKNVGITRLADIIHDFESRKEAVLELITNLKGTIRVIFNLASYAKKFLIRCKKLGLRNVECISYTLGSKLDYRDIDNLIYMEYPIVKEYLLLDIEAKLKPDCNVFHLKSDAVVDVYLANRFDRQKAQLSDFLAELWQLKKPKVASKPPFEQLNLF